MKWLE